MRTFYLSVLLTGIVDVCFGQTKITGKITDQKGEPVPGANIVVQDTYDGTSSEADGSFAFVTEEKGVKILVVSSVGYTATSNSVELSGASISLTIELYEQINQLEAVEISAGSFTAGEEHRRTILKAIDIATTAGATADIAGVFNTLPGTQKVGESGRLFVRGGDGNETRTFIDGMVVLDAYGIAAPNTPSRGRFLPFMFKGTSFSTGGYSAEYGQALSSALILNSKDKAEQNQTDIGLLSVGADLAHTQVWDRSSWSGKIQYTNIRPYIGLIDQRVDWITPPASLEGSTAYRHQVGETGRFKFFGNFNRSNFSLYNHDIINPQLKQRYELTNNYAYGNATYTDVLNEKWNIRGGVSYTANENKNNIASRPFNESEKGIHSKLIFDHSLSDRVELKFGTEIISRIYEASRQDSVSLEILKQSFNESISATFAEAEIYASNRFVTRAGARMEYNSLTNGAFIDPRLSLAYRPGRKGQFAFAYGVFRQSPKNQYVRISNRLASETAEHFIFNYQIISDSRTFRVETYYKRYDDLVKFQDEEGYVLNNSGTGDAKGIELFWRDSKTLKNVDYWISYSYLDTKRNYLNFPYAAAPSFSSKHNFSVVYKHFITNLKTQVGVTYSYSSARPYHDPNADAFNSGKTPSYQDLSMNISYLPKNFLIIHFSCTNLLGRDNVFGYQYSNSKDANGVFQSRPVQQAAKRFLFIGMFITLSKNKSVNQLPNL
jgi:hypothetical protein